MIPVSPPTPDDPRAARIRTELLYLSGNSEPTLRPAISDAIQLERALAALVSLAADLEQAETVIRHVEGALLAYWTDIPQGVIQHLLAEIQATYAPAALAAGSVAPPHGDTA